MKPDKHDFIGEFASITSFRRFSFSSVAARERFILSRRRPTFG